MRNITKPVHGRPDSKRGEVCSANFAQGRVYELGKTKFGQGRRQKTKTSDGMMLGTSRDYSSPIFRGPGSGKEPLARKGRQRAE